MGLYSNYATDAELEKRGVIIDYGEFRVLLARAGGANKAFARVAAAKTKPHRRAIQAETIDLELSEQLTREIYAETVILDWETKVNGKFVRGIEPPDGDLSKLLEVTPANICATLANLPDLMTDLREQAGSAALYRQEMLEEDAKN